MFTGIVEQMGMLISNERSRISVRTKFPDLVTGESIAVNGVCLTVTDIDEGSFAADVSEETLLRTTIGALSVSSFVNLERAMSASGRFGGHIMQGHVDGVGDLSARYTTKDSTEMWFDIPSDLSRYVVVKGSIAIDGVSLTVSKQEGDRLAVAVIPHTLEVTNLGGLSVGSKVNIEVDIIAKYVERLTAS